MSGDVSDRKRLIAITAGNLRNSHIYIRSFCDLLPNEFVGGTSKKQLANKMVTLYVDGLPHPIKTDIATDKTGKRKGIFRNQKWVKEFFKKQKIEEGDIIAFDHVDEGIFRVRLHERKNSNASIQTQGNNIGKRYDRYESKEGLKNPTPENDPNEKTTRRYRKVLSLFSGCGGMDLGFEGEFKVLKRCVNMQIHPEWVKKVQGKWIILQPTNFKIIFANDISLSAMRAWRSYFKNRGHSDNTFHLGSIVDLVKIAREGKNVFPKNVDIITGGFPCQDFSNAGKRRGFQSHRSHNGKLMATGEPTIESRGALYMWMREVIDIVRPKMFIAENVKALTTLADTKRIIENDFASIGQDGYIVLSRIFHAAEYGVPQTRERILFYGFSRAALLKKALIALISGCIPEDLDPFPTVTHWLPGKLYPYKHRDKLEKFVTTREALIGLPEPDNNLADASQKSYSGAAYYGRHCQGNVEVNLDSPCFTIRAEHHGNIEFRRLSKEHGGKNYDELRAGLSERRLTVRECARLQTFPDDYEFVRKGEFKDDNNKISCTEGYVLVGNAVPPLLAYHIARRLEQLWPLLFKEK